MQTQVQAQKRFPDIDKALLATCSKTFSKKERDDSGDYQSQRTRQKCALEPHKSTICQLHGLSLETFFLLWHSSRLILSSFFFKWTLQL